MQTNTNTIAWVAIALFLALIIVFIVKPHLENGTTNISERFETVTTGGEWQPPSTWEPGKK